uniref:Uncharacterized protein n=1 Tax=Arundo donax TaxID=35708 RepID=A0A0A8ZM95_ARUDO
MRCELLLGWNYQVENLIS